jgi:DNA polymerase-3 subunit delta'
MLFENSVIQQQVKIFFNNVIKNDRLAHAYLFYGKEGSGKTAFAFELAKVLNCLGISKPCNSCPSCVKINNASHPDVKFVFPLSKVDYDKKRMELTKLKTQNPYKKIASEGHLNIPIESIRELKKEAAYAPFEAKKRVFIISGIEFFSREAANSFLKLLEEPPANLLIILISNDYNSVLDTIRSRCQPVLFPTFMDDEIKTIIKPYNEKMQDLTSLFRINENNTEKIIELLEQDSADIRPLIVDFLRASAKASWLDINNIVEQLLIMRDKNKILEFINLLMLWLTDAYRYKIMQSDCIFINADMQEPISKFADYYLNVNYSSLFLNLEQTYKDIKGNVNTGLSLYNLSVEIKNILNADGPVEMS